MVRSVSSEAPDLTNIKMEELAPILKSIIVTRTKEGATIDEIIDDYFEFTGDDLLSLCRSRDSVGDVLRKVEGVWCMYRSPNGPCLWYCSTENTKHLAEMIKKQKSPRFQNRRYQQPKQTPYSYKIPASTNNDTGPRDKFYPDNMNFIPKRNWNRGAHRSVVGHPYMGAPQWRQAQQVKPLRKPIFHPMMTPMPNYYSNNAIQSGPTLCGLQMIGDDFFLSLARWELGFLFDPGHDIQKSGLCVSGLTIAEAAYRVQKATYINDRVIVNVGVVDLLHGHDIVDMQQDLLQLLKNLEVRGASAILCTLSPLANSSHISGITDRLHKFNDLIRKFQCPYIDVWRCFVNERNNTLYECFQPGPRQVSGSNKPHVLWNKLGRQRIIKFIKTELAGLI